MQPNQHFRSLGRLTARKARKLSNRVSLALVRKDALIIYRETDTDATLTCLYGFKS